MSSTNSEESSESLRQRGNSHYRQFCTTGSTDLKKTYLRSALGCYRDAYSVACKNQSKPIEDLKKCAKNIAVCCKYLSGLENHGVTKIMYFNESAKYFSKALNYHAGAKSCGEMQWLSGCVANLQEVFDGFLNHLERTWPKQRLSLLNEFLTNLNRHSPFEEEQRMVAASLCTQANMIFNQAASCIAEKDYKQGMRLLKDMHYPMEEAKRLAAVFKADRELQSELNIMENDYRTNIVLAEALQVYHKGKDLLNVAIYEEENFKVKLVWDAVDKFREAVVIAHGEDVEFECLAMERIAYIYNKIFKRPKRAKVYYETIRDLAETLVGRNKYEFEWYVAVAGFFREMQEQLQAKEASEWQNRKRPILEQYKDELNAIEEKSDNATDKDFIEFLLQNYPPTHKPNHVTWKPDFSVTTNKEWECIFRKMSTFYYPDTVIANVEEHGLKYCVFCEEISKYVIVRYQETKDGEGNSCRRQRGI